MTSVDPNFNFLCGRPHGTGPPVHMRPPEPDPLPLLVDVRNGWPQTSHEGYLEAKGVQWTQRYASWRCRMWEKMNARSACLATTRIPIIMRKFPGEEFKQEI